MVARFPPGGSILDVGGGNGFVTKGMIEAGYRAALLEPDPIGVANAQRHRGLTQIICATLEEAGLEKQSVAAIGLFDVLEHAADEAAFIELVYAILRPEGILYATVPAHACLWSLSDQTAQHHRRYHEDTLRRLLGEKYEILYFTYLFSALVLPIFILRVLPYRLGLAKSHNFLSPEREHACGSGLASRVFSIFLRRELAAIQQGRRLSAGASCMLAARKRVLG